MPDSSNKNETMRQELRKNGNSQEERALLTYLWVV